MVTGPVSTDARTRPRRGVFITFEGGDGAGKSTLLRQVERHVAALGVPFVVTREPGGSPVADEIRQILLKPDRKLSSLAELFLFEAARAEHVDALIRPALARGALVLCDRFTHSTLAFQGYARGLGSELVSNLNRLATSGVEPDAIVWLKLSPKQARDRIATRGESSRIDDEKAAFHEAVFDAFQDLARTEAARFIVLDASRPPADVFNELTSHPLWTRLVAGLTA